jgi:RimJ/RimL family protein N-acetyltransferase
MSLVDKLKRIPAVYSDQGLAGLGKALGDRVLEHTKFVVLQRDLRLEVPPASCSLPFQLRRVDDNLLKRFRDMPPPFPRHFEYRERFGMRHCYAAWVGTEIAALMWPVFEADNERLVTRWRYLWPDETRLASIWASPAYRGTGLMDACYERFERLVRGAGFRYLYTFTWSGNRGSQRLAARRGLREVGWVHRYSFRWQREGSGFYIRKRIPREPLGPDHPGGDLELPDVLE